MIRIGAPRRPQSGDEEYLPNLDGTSCAQGHLIGSYVARRLRVRTQTQFELHLFSCEHCLRAVEFELLVQRAVADFARFAHFSRSWH
jgi:hypothetical protein